MTTAPEMVIVVDADDVELATADRDQVHRQGVLHRAVSVFLFNDRGELLLQRRASTKATFAGKWANTCCTHPRPGEDLVSAGERRLAEEMGLKVSLHWVGSFVYHAEDAASGYVEHELDHVLVGQSDRDPILDPAEAGEFRWVDVNWLRSEMSGTDYAPWLGEALTHFPDLGVSR